MFEREKNRATGYNQPVRKRKWAKFIIALFLLPVCAATAETLWRVLRAGGHADTVWVPLLAGAACWLVVFLMLPKPMWLYVLGHELTHALWTWLCWGRVRQLKVSSEGGHVVVTKDNFLIALAPYFFPLYAVLVVLGFGIGKITSLGSTSCWERPIVSMSHSHGTFSKPANPILHRRVIFFRQW